jgi:hypothetical protein
MFVDPSRDRARISSAWRTLLAQSSVSAMGHNPRVVGVHAGHDGGGSLPLERTPDGFLPSKERVLVVLMQVLFFDQENYRDRVAEAFRAAVLRPPLLQLVVLMTTSVALLSRSFERPWIRWGTVSSTCIALIRCRICFMSRT